MSHPGPAFETSKEKLARARAKELNKAPARLKEKVKEADPNSLESVRDESAFHLGNLYYAESRLAAGVKDDEARDELVELVRLARLRHEELSAVAGKLMARGEPK